MDEVEEIYNKYYKLDMLLKIIREAEGAEDIKEFLSEEQCVENLIYMISNNISISKYLLYRRKGEDLMSLSDYLGINTDIVAFNRLLVMSIESDFTGLKTGDIITKVNDKNPLSTFKFHEEDLQIKFLRLDTEKDIYVQKIIVIKKDKIDSIDFASHFCENYIDLRDFRDIEELQDILNKSYDEITIDLRFNFGGAVEDVREALGCILPKDTVIAYIEDEGELRALTTTRSPLAKVNKINILTSQLTASSAEIFTIALKKYLNVEIIGESKYTFGKEYIQNSYALTDKSYMAIPKYRIYTPDKEKLVRGIIKVDKLLNEAEIEKRYVNKEQIERGGMR